MAPRLYLIFSDERSGLVKIGRTDPSESSLDDIAVIERVRSYATGISDSATVIQAPGAAIFEKWLHKFVGTKQKSVTIKFAFRPGSTISPKEWFELSPDLAQVLGNAFMSDPPKTIDEVNNSDWPVFFAGALTAIRWHAENESLETLAALAKTLELQSFAQDLVSYQDSVTPKLSTIPGPIEAQFSLSEANSAENLLEAPIKAARLEVQMQELKETEKLRTYIALVVSILVAVMGIFGSPGGATLFAIIGCLLLAFWPNYLPRITKMVVDYMHRDAILAREKNSTRISNE